MVGAGAPRSRPPSDHAAMAATTTAMAPMRRAPRCAHDRDGFGRFGVTTGGVSRFAAPLELRGVSAARQHDAHLVGRAVAVVVLLEPAPQAPGLDAHDRIEARVVLVIAVEDLDADRVFLQLIGFARQRSFDHVAQEAAQSPGIRKALAGENAVELGSNRLGGNRWIGGHDRSMNRNGRRGIAAGADVTVTTTVTCFK